MSLWCLFFFNSPCNRWPDPWARLPSWCSKWTHAWNCRTESWKKFWKINEIDAILMVVNKQIIKISSLYKFCLAIFCNGRRCNAGLDIDWGDIRFCEIPKFDFFELFRQNKLILEHIVVKKKSTLARNSKSVSNKIVWTWSREPKWILEKWKLNVTWRNREIV